MPSCQKSVLYDTQSFWDEDNAIQMVGLRLHILTARITQLAQWKLFYVWICYRPA